jgi:thymidine kinase
MSNLIFKYGAMSASKSADLIITKYNYDKNYVKNLAIKPSMDTRDKKISSRIGLNCECETVNNYFDINYILNHASKPDVILIDEIQFFDPKMIDVLVNLADNYNKLIFCYGLLVDFREKLFPASKRLIEVGAKLVEMKTTCQEIGCKNAATHTLATYTDGKRLEEDAPQYLITLNKEIVYYSLCRQHWNGKCK